MPTFVNMYQNWARIAAHENYVDVDEHIDLCSAKRLFIVIYGNAFFAILWYFTHLRFIIFPVGMGLGILYVFDFLSMFFLAL